MVKYWRHGPNLDIQAPKTPKITWPWNDLGFCKKWKYFFKNSVINFWSWNFKFRFRVNFLMCCHLQNYKNSNSLGEITIFLNRERVIFVRNISLARLFVWNFFFFYEKVVFMWNVVDQNKETVLAFQIWHQKSFLDDIWPWCTV